MRKQNTPAKAKSSTPRRKKTDPLTKYRKLAAPLIRMLFDTADDAPAFMRDQLFELLTDLESETQVFWNVKEIAVVAIPLMLQAADKRGIDWQDARSPFIVRTLRGMYNCYFDDNDDLNYTPPEDEDAKLKAELLLDAQAIAHLLNSPTVPESIKSKLCDRTLEAMDGHAIDPEVIRVQYPRALLASIKELQKGDASDEATDD
jgi:hypothetical protein